MWVVHLLYIIILDEADKLMMTLVTFEKKILDTHKYKKRKGEYYSYRKRNTIGQSTIIPAEPY